ncbi:WS/DGAT domain-containing protein [Ornithinimicrobium sp. W1679]|uniref:WS/DGAT domain-containing protein n=1 Tax=Ornithinimicrobium sp. W1679 TaxID=3418770 RepID=UPI003CEABC1F
MRVFVRGPAALERLSAADASNVVLDAPDQVNAFLLAGLLAPGGWVPPGGVPDLDQLRAVVAERIGDHPSGPTGPPSQDGATDPPSTSTQPGSTGSTGSTGPLRRFSQRVVLRRRQLVWEPCEPDLRWHVRAVAPVDGSAGMAQLCAALMTQQVDPDRPLWELLVVPGAATDAPGLVLRVHHAVADGAVGVQMLGALLDPGRPVHAAQAPPVHASQAPPVPAVPTRRRIRLRPDVWLTGLRRVTAVVRATVPATVLLGPIGPHRGVAFAEVDLAPLARAARGAGATVNDALLAAVCVATEHALAVAGQPVPPVLPASVPVVLPDHRGSGNAVGVMLVDLPTGEQDRCRRLAAVAARTSAAKADARAQGTFELTRTRWGARLFARLARRQHFVALFVTNVRGPQEELSLGGAPLVRAWPVTPLQGNVRLGVSALSYAGRLGCTVHVDGDVLRADVLARTLQEQLQEHPAG